MKRRNVEVKARCTHQDAVRDRLRERGARFVGEDRQVDVYFEVPQGRLKLRQGAIENALIYYTRPDREGPKQSDVLLHPAPEGASLRAVLAEALGERVVVNKRREIYFIDNVKFHLDRVEGLGTFVEIEAIDDDGTRSPERLRTQCEAYLQFLGIEASALVAGSYSDLLLQEAAPGG
jgi:predicted adenylyl cyclase CyaB